MKDNSYNKVFGSTLSFYIQNKGISLSEIAEFCCVVPHTVHQWCSGLRFPSLDHLIDLSLFLGVSFNDLFMPVAFIKIFVNSFVKAVDDSVNIKSSDKGSKGDI